MEKDSTWNVLEKFKKQEKFSDVTHKTNEYSGDEFLNSIGQLIENCNGTWLKILTNWRPKDSVFVLVNEERGSIMIFSNRTIEYPKMWVVTVILKKPISGNISNYFYPYTTKYDVRKLMKWKFNEFIGTNGKYIFGPYTKNNKRFSLVLDNHYDLFGFISKILNS